MTGHHIRKERDGTWTIPDHVRLLRQCHLFPIEVYIERRRGTLRRYLEQHRNALLTTAQTITHHCRAVNSILWWRQTWITKSDVDMMASQWFSV